MTWNAISILAVLLRTAVIQAVADHENQHPIFEPDTTIINSVDDPFPPLNFSSPSPLIFHSTFALLQQWPNTFFEFGHTITSCTIPTHTNLYHASADSAPIPSPEWFAFDAEMSYSISGLFPNSHLFTYRTRREVRCLYFDGASASLHHDGDTDSQMTFLYNSSANVPPKRTITLPPVWRDMLGKDTIYDQAGPEFDRATRLCDFIRAKGLGGLGWGYEGVVRMNAGFELIWCNFSSPSIKLVSWLNVTAPVLESVPDGTTDERLAVSADHSSRALEGRTPWLFPGYDNPFMFGAQFAQFRAATNVYGFAGGVAGRGETRVKADSCGIFSLYDAGMRDQEATRIRTERLALNLTQEGVWRSPEDDDERQAALKKLGRRRREQRPGNVSEADGAYMRRAVEQRMRATLDVERDQHCSGIDWVKVARDLVAAYSTELYKLSLLLGQNDVLHPHEIRGWLRRVRDMLHEFWMPFYEYPPFTPPTLDRAFHPSAPQSLAALERCRRQSAPLDSTPLSPSEELTYTAIADVLSNLCATLLPIFLSTEKTWLSNFNNASLAAPPPSPPTIHSLEHTMRLNHRAVEDLMAWLGWTDQWTTCDPACALGEVCYLPMWPVLALPAMFRNGSLPVPGRHRDLGSVRRELLEMLWEPVCVDADTFPPVK